MSDLTFVQYFVAIDLTKLKLTLSDIQLQNRISQCSKAKPILFLVLSQWRLWLIVRPSVGVQLKLRTIFTSPCTCC